MKSEKITLSQLENFLFRSADILRSKVDASDFYYNLMMDSFRCFTKEHGSDLTVLHFQTQSVLGLELEIIYSKPEQTKIAKILSTVDRAVEQTEVLIAKQQRITIGLMQNQFTCGIDEHCYLHLEHTHEFKDSPLEGFQ